MNMHIDCSISSYLALIIIEFYLIKKYQRKKKEKVGYCSYLKHMSGNAS